MPKHRPDVGRIPSFAMPGTSPASDDLRMGVGAGGVDVPGLTRVVALRGRTLRERVLTSGELEARLGSRSRPAARFAAKEAVAKALGVGIGQVFWRDVAIRTGAHTTGPLT